MSMNLIPYTLIFFVLLSCQYPFIKKEQDKQVEGKIVSTSDEINTPKKNDELITPNYAGKKELCKQKNEQKVHFVMDSSLSFAERAKKKFDRLIALDNTLVRRWIALYQKGNGRKFEKALSRGEKYRKIIEPYLEKNDLPQQLAYLPLIESGYRNTIRSKARAVGLWQFLRGTARAYGLKINSFVDERRDPYLSTIAAIKYLKDLYRVYLDWPLALAAYNAGENRILGTIMLGKSRDYWQLVKEKRLPRETRNYLPKFIASTKIAMNPEKYGFQVPPFKHSAELIQVDVPPLISFSLLSELTKVSKKKLREFNPAILRNKTPAYIYKLWLPKESLSFLHQAKKTLLRESKRQLAQYKRLVPKGYHKVRYGESLYTISRKYKLSVKRLKRMNRLNSNRIYPGNILRIRDKA